MTPIFHMRKFKYRRIRSCTRCHTASKQYDPGSTQTMSNSRILNFNYFTAFGGKRFIKYSFALKYFCWNSTISKSVIEFYNWKRPQYSHDSILIQRQHPGQLGLNTSSGGELIIASSSHQLTDQIFNKNIKMLITFSLPGTLLEHGRENLQHVEPISAILNFFPLCLCSALWKNTDCVCGSWILWQAHIYLKTATKFSDFLLACLLNLFLYCIP